MSRSICVLFVALASFQAAFANVAVERTFMNLESANETSPTVDLFDAARANALVGDMTIGEHKDGETMYTYKYRNENYDSTVKESIWYMHVDKDKTIHYMNAVNSNGIIAVLCPTRASLGNSVTFLHIRQPPNSESLITINIGAH